MKKTNAMRILDGLKIPYEVKSYDDDGEHYLEQGAAERISEKLGLDARCVFKTIVMRTDTKEICIFCQNALHQINLKKARAACGASEVFPVKSEELLPLTGYVRGGCTPLGMRKKYRTFIDKSALDCKKICISAGIRGEQIILSPHDLIRVADAQCVDLILESS
ncbi:aminoacyl-tRNA deacylase [Treponema parvum]|uniref:Cys-tRNA(Pro)/Cys-tRNA(Cys) deacylase n=1 Tax=Treponema parvum TaxID=138851 RepID=A0A975F1H7_9SPIR|nr:aminoacyl-tRNA deacylase [Treponema parvum]QTQ12565.1 aminoacyl-tRNA deacylase [Treponema parvum]